MPYKNPPDNAKWAYTAARYNQPFDLDAIAERIGYPLFMKPYDGGAWVGVTRIKNADDLHAAYDASGQRLMHLQKAVEGYDVFARSLSIGAETMVMKFRPELPMHDRYAVDHDFLTPEVGDEVVTISRLVNAFFRWEFNSCENLVRGHRGAPDRLRQRLPGRRAHLAALLLPVGDGGAGALDGVHVVTGRKPRLDLDIAPLLRGRRPRGPLLRREARRATGAWPTSTSRPTATSTSAPAACAHLDEVVLEWVDSAEFDALLVETVEATYPAHEHDRFVAHFRGLVGLWVRDAKAALDPGGQPA